MRSGALDSKTKYLIALGVAGQIPCRYCLYFDTTAAKHAGATDAEIKEANRGGCAHAEVEHRSEWLRL
jgi:AhpD family alkylhydroperoxidase